MKIKSLNLKTSKLEELFHFYQDVMGMCITDKGETSFSIECGNTNLCFENDDSYQGAFYHFAFNSYA